MYECNVEESRPPLWSSGQFSWLQSGDVLWFLWGTNWIYICYVVESRPPLWSSGQSSWLQIGGVLCFLWGTNWIYICYVVESRPPLWCSGQSSWLHNGDVLCLCGQGFWLQIQKCGFDSRRYQIFWEVVGLERGPLSLVITIQEPFERNSRGSGIESRKYGLRDPSRWPRGTNCPTIGGRSVGIVRSRTQAREFSFYIKFSFPQYYRL
jgi:hypothetical protein